MTIGTFLSQTYDEARDKFLAATQARGPRIERRLYPGTVGPFGEQLSIDTVLFIPTQAQTLLIFIPGVHGVEGLCSSGCQVGLLQDDELFVRLATAKIALLLAHAVNPCGFARL